MTLDIPFHITCIDKELTTTVKIFWRYNSLSQPLYMLISYDNVSYFRIDNSNVSSDNSFSYKLKYGESIYLKTDSVKEAQCTDRTFQGRIANITILNGKAAIAGNINSLITSDYSNPDLDLDKARFVNLFSGLFKVSERFENAKHLASLVDASELLLPAKSIPNGCYKLMFMNNTKLKYPPKILPAQYVPITAYEDMFNGCSSLVSIPTILGTEFNMDACSGMFIDCTELKDISNFVQEIDSITAYSFYKMFYKCDNLEKFPKKLYVKKQIHKYGMLVSGMNSSFMHMFSVDLPLDYLLSLNLNGKICHKLFSTMLLPESFQGKISLFKYYGLFADYKDIL